MIGPAANPDQMLGDRVPPEAGIGAAQPELPVFQAGTHVLVVATDALMDRSPYHGGVGHTIEAQESSAHVESAVILRFLGAEEDAVAVDKGTLGMAR